MKCNVLSVEVLSADVEHPALWIRYCSSRRTSGPPGSPPACRRKLSETPATCIALRCPCLSARAASLGCARSRSSRGRSTCVPPRCLSTSSSCSGRFPRRSRSAHEWRERRAEDRARKGSSSAHVQRHSLQDCGVLSWPLPPGAAAGSSDRCVHGDGDRVLADGASNTPDADRPHTVNWSPSGMVGHQRGRVPPIPRAATRGQLPSARRGPHAFRPNCDYALSHMPRAWPEAAEVLAELAGKRGVGAR